MACSHRLKPFKKQHNVRIINFHFLTCMSTAENPSARPSRLCPACRSIQDKNFDRHLNHHFDVSTKEGRKEKLRVKEEASRRTVQGLREGKPQLLPMVFRQALTSDTKVLHDFRQFLDDVGVILPKQLDTVEQQTAPTPAEATKRKQIEDDHDSGQEVRHSHFRQLTIFKNKFHLLVILAQSKQMCKAMTLSDLALNNLNPLVKHPIRFEKF